MTKPVPSDLGVDTAARGEEILGGKQTRLATANFKISGLRFPRAFIQGLGLIKACAARVDGDLGLLPADVVRAIEEGAMAVAEGWYDDQFPVDVLQTGSGTSTNMNANEVCGTWGNGCSRLRRVGRQSAQD